MAQQFLTQDGSFSASMRDPINANFSELYSQAGVAAGNSFGVAYYVDGDSGSDSFTGVSPATAKATIQAAVTLASENDRIYIKPRSISAGGTDPANYAETIIIPAGKSGLWLVGMGGGVTQGSQPQIKKGSGSTALLTVRSPGCVITGLTFNGSGSTGGGILLDDDGSTKSAFGTVISGCYFKNCKGHATNGKLGGAIAWSSAGGAWQVQIVGNRFYDNVDSICLIGTSGSRPKDVVISGNTFGGDAATAVDAYIYGAGGSGFVDVTLVNNVFSTVLPNNTSGTIHRYVDLTGVDSGIVAHNFFATAAGQFGAGGNSGLVPTTVMLTGNYIESGLLART